MLRNEVSVELTSNYYLWAWKLNPLQVRTLYYRVYNISIWQHEQVDWESVKSLLTPMVNQIFVVSGVPLVQTLAGPENPPVSPVVARNSKNTICLVKWIFIEEHFVCQGQDTSCDSLVLRISILFYELKSGEHFSTIEFPFLTLRLIKHK